MTDWNKAVEAAARVVEKTYRADDCEDPYGLRARRIRADAARRIRELHRSEVAVSPLLVGPVGAIISDGIMRSRAAAIQPPPVATTWPKGRELLELVLSNHYATAVECDHETRTDIVRCACSRWTGTSQPSVGAAIKEWINHIAGILDAGDYLSAVGGAAAPQLSVPAEPRPLGVGPIDVVVAAVSVGCPSCDAEVGDYRTQGNRICSQRIHDGFKLLTPPAAPPAGTGP